MSASFEAAVVFLCFHVVDDKTPFGERWATYAANSGERLGGILSETRPVFGTLVPRSFARAFAGVGMQHCLKGWLSDYPSITVNPIINANKC